MGIMQTSLSPSSTIPHPPINLPQIKPLNLTLHNLAHDLRRPPSHDRKTRNHHIGRDDRVVQDPDIIFYDGELPNNYIRAYMDMAPNKCRFNDRACTYEDMVCYL